MSKAAQSILVFGIYLVFLGAVLVLTPNTLLGVFGIASTTEVWIRVIGVLVLALAFYYISAARQGVTDFFRWTVYGRVWILVAFIGFTVVGWADPRLILFGVVDALGALWTGLALRGKK